MHGIGSVGDRAVVGSCAIVSLVLGIGQLLYGSLGYLNPSTLEWRYKGKADELREPPSWFRVWLMPVASDQGG